MKKLSYTARVLITYSIIAVTIIGLSCIGLIWSNWYVIMCAAIASVGALINAFLLIKSSEYLSPDSKKSSMAFMLGGNAFRSIVMFISIGLCALIIFLTYKGEDKTVFLNILVAGAPFIGISLATILVRHDEPQVGGNE